MATVQPAGMRDKLESAPDAMTAPPGQRNRLFCYACCIIHEALWLNMFTGHKGGAGRPKQSRVLLLSGEVACEGGQEKFLSTHSLISSYDLFF